VRSGARQIVAFHFPGEFVDLQSCLPAVNDHSVQALGTCELAAVPKAALLAPDRSAAEPQARQFRTYVAVFVTKRC
jgi:CRP-like cAMP-binding protein